MYEDVDVCDGVCGGEAFDGGGGDELGISGISEDGRKLIEAVMQRDWCPLRRISDTYR